MNLPILPPIVEAEPGRNYDDNYILWWNNVALDLNRVTHSLGGPQNGPPLSARALAILHLAIHDAYFSVMPDAAFSLYLTAGPAPVFRAAGAANTPLTIMAARDAVAGAAMTVLNKLYKRPLKLDNNPSQKSLTAISSFIDKALTDFIRMTNENHRGLDITSPSFAFGAGIAKGILGQLEIKAGEPGTDKGIYVPKDRDYFFGDEPTHPVILGKVDPNDQSATPAMKANRPYHGPLYGSSAQRFALQSDHVIADPPVIPQNGIAGASPADILEYRDAVADVHRMGGAPNDRNTLRQDYQTAGALFWAYDGANLIGTPPRLYNQILRQVAFDKNIHKAPNSLANDQINTEEANAEFARLFALANVALADAGILAWREKYTYELWRPLSGVRQDPSGPAGSANVDGIARPTWLTFGAPQTNSHLTPFKPPFPSYPSGHATFGAAMFQMIRLFYKHRDGASAPWKEDEADDICFQFVSDEMNGVNRDLDKDYDPTTAITEQPGIMRTKHVRKFSSLWEAMFDNALSRVWLGVHWRFDAFAATDVLKAKDVPKAQAVLKDDHSLYAIESDGTTAYKDAHDVKYATLGARTVPTGPTTILAGTGGVPLGIAIANDIFNGNLRPAAAAVQPPNVW